MYYLIFNYQYITGMVCPQINGEARSMLSSVVEYETHLNDVYGKDTFYGDPTLESLLEHTNRIADQIQEYVSANEDLTTEDSDA